MAAINKLFFQKDAFGRIIVGSKIALIRWQKPLSGVFCKKGVLKNFAKFTILNKAAGLKPSILLKRDSSTGVLLWILQKILKTPIPSKVWERLLLDWQIHAKLLNGFYTFIIFSVECWGNSFPCRLFPLYSYTLDFKLYKQGYNSCSRYNRSIVALS